MLKKQAYLQTQVGNPEGDDKPNKKVFPVLFTVKSPIMNLFQFYDPRVWVREGEKTLAERVKVACQDLGNVGRL